MSTEKVSNEEKGNGVLADVINGLSIEDKILHELIAAERNKQWFPMTEEENAVLFKYKQLIHEAMHKFKNCC
jgi:hypothetical protein